MAGHGAFVGAHDEAVEEVQIILQHSRTGNVGAENGIHRYNVVFPFAVPVEYVDAVAGRRFHARFSLDRNAGAGTVQSYLHGITPANGIFNWTILTAAETNALNAGNIAHNLIVANSYPVDLIQGSVVRIYMAEQELPAQHRRGHPTDRMQNLALPNTIQADITRVVGQFNTNFPATLLVNVGPETPYIRTGFDLQQHEPLFSYPSGFSVYPEVNAPFSIIPKFFPLLIQDARHYNKRSVLDVNRCIRCLKGGSLRAELLGSCELGFWLDDDVSQFEKPSSIVNLALPRIEIFT